MSIKAETNNSEDEIWKKRKDALLAFVKNKMGDVEEEIINASEKASEGTSVRSIKEDLDKLIELKPGLEEGMVPENIKLWDQFLYVYEQRQRKVCLDLLDLLTEFTDDAVASFLPASEHNEGYSQRHLWRVLLNEVSTDLQIVPAAAHQRARDKDGQFDKEVSSANTLLKADIIAEQALGQAIERGFLQKTPIITYLKEDVSIRTVPYAETVMIGVAYASMEPGFGEPNEAGISFSKVSRDMLAIPHEVGHYLYWKGQILEEGKKQSVFNTLQKRFEKAKIWAWDWRSDWLEEIFADAYGLLVAGPVMALSFQDLLTDNLPSRFREDTGRHPIPALRPYIQTRILRGITIANGYPLYPLAPTLLDAKWEGKPIWNGDNPLEVDYTLHGVPNPAKGQQILGVLDEIIEIVLETFQTQDADGNLTHGSWNPWTMDVQDPVGLYDKLTFENFLPFSDSWFLTSKGVDWKSDPEKWPERITAGWREKAPEDRGG